MMGPYLKPLRRKIGVVTLVMACVLMAGWFRSTFVKDHLTRDHGDGSSIQAISYDGHFGIVERKGFSKSGRTEIRFRQSSVESIHQWVGEGDGWAWYQFGFGLIHEKYENGHLKGWFVDYRSIAIPLTLLSAYLLFSQPRAKKTDSIAPKLMAHSAS